MAKLQKQNSESLENSIFKSREIYISCFKLAFEGKVTFLLQFNMYCSVVFIYDWSLYVTCMNYWKTNHTDQNSQGWEVDRQSTGADNMTTSQAWELSGLFPTLGNRLCPTAKLVFHLGIAFVKVWKSKQYRFPRMPVLWSPESSENN